jgi:hypothetical protein
MKSMSGAHEELVIKTCKTSPRNGQHRFCKVVKVDMANSREKPFDDTILSTLSLITVLYEVFFGSINIHKALIDRDNSHDPQPFILLLNKTKTSVGFIYEGGIIKQDEYNSLQKELLKLLEAFCVFGC